MSRTTTFWVFVALFIVGFPLLYVVIFFCSVAEGAEPTASLDCAPTEFRTSQTLGPLICLTSNDCVNAICYLYIPEGFACYESSGVSMCEVPEHLTPESLRK